MNTNSKMMSNSASAPDDHATIRQMVLDWVRWRDGGEWERFATLWHSDGCMVTTWFKASAADFIARSSAAAKAGVKAHHTLGESEIDIIGDRAIAQTKMQIVQRDAVHGVLVDVTCEGRFWDAYEKRDGRWGLLLRQPIYEGDTMVPVNAADVLTLDATLLASFPEGYRHLAYLQTQIGLKINMSLPGTHGAEVEDLYARGRRWMAGGELG